MSEAAIRKFGYGLSEEEHRDRIERALAMVDAVGKREPKETRKALGVDEVCKAVGERVVGREREIRLLAEYFEMWLIRRSLLRNGADREELPACRCAFVTGPTASGKTYLIRLIAREFGFRYVPESLASLTGSGWRGRSVSDVLCEAADWQREHQGEVQVLFWDEADKHRMDEIREGGITFNPACDLLKVLDAEEGVYRGTVREDGQDRPFALNLDDCVFVFAGAFSDISERVVRPRLMREAGAGYGVLAEGSAREAALADSDTLRTSLQPEDLLEWGIMSELLGRASHVISMPALSEGDLMRIANGSPHSLERKNGLLMPDGVVLSIGDEAARGMAQRARDSSLGARMLDGMLQPIVAHAATLSRSCEGVARVEVGWDAGSKSLTCSLLDAEGRVLECE